MDAPKIRDYKREWFIGGQIYDVKFKRKLDRNRRGECCADGEILIALGQNRDEVLRTLVHELFHAIEFAYEIKIPHALIYKLEGPVAELIKDNF
jgi:Zn-dependent peptidase ImmA (M78 family)